MKPRLRDYQSQAIRDVRSALEVHRSAMLVLPTASGKTLTAIDLALERTAKGPVWFLAHRDEIIRQAARSFISHNAQVGIVSPNLPVFEDDEDLDGPKEAWMNDWRAEDPSLLIQVGSVQSIRARMKRYPAPATIFWDEAHHMAAATWAAIMEAFPEAKHIGLTATPTRLDRKRLGDFFETMIVGANVPELIAAGHLAPIRYFAPSEPDLQRVKIKNRDYDRGAVEEVMSSSAIVGDAVSEYQKWIPGDRAIAYCASVAHAESVSAKFNAAGIPSVTLDANTSPVIREQVLKSLKAGRVKVVCNVEILTEGADVPALDGVILLRPTKSTSLFLQMCGRAMRPQDGKTAFIMDHAGLYLDHGLPNEARDWSFDKDAHEEFVEGVRRTGARYLKDQHGEVTRVERDALGGREVAEFEGVLWELRGEVPAGCERYREFGKRFGWKESQVAGQVSRGMPILGGRKNKEGKLSYVPVDLAINWLKLNPPPQYPPLFVEDPENFISQSEAAKLLNLSRFPRSAAAAGVTIAPNGWVYRPTLLAAWDNRKLKKAGRNPPQIDGFVAAHEFRKRFDLSSTFFAVWEPKGAPRRTAEGLVCVAEMLAFLKNRRSPLMPPIWRDDWRSYELQGHFARRIGVVLPTTGAYRQRGLPCAENGWVHIYRGLCWVRDNTKIEIPPSAWEGVEPDDEA